MKNLFTLICIILICCGIGMAEENETNLTQINTTNITNVTNTTITNITNITKILPVPEQFYGSVKYSDGSLVEAGNIVRVTDSSGNEIGSFNMTENGTYGDSYDSAPRLLVHAEEEGSVIIFYVNTIKSTKTMKFDSAGIKRADIVIPSVFKPTPVPTTIATPEPTPIPTPTTIVTTEEPTPIITATPVPTTIATPEPTPTQNITQEPNDALIKFAGVLLIAIGICVFGAIATYFILTKKMKREDDEEITLDYK